MARDPASGIELTHNRRANCLTCAQGKQTKNTQLKKCTGKNTPIDRVGGVIGGDRKGRNLKGPMTTKDQLGNRYMVNFIDYKSNYYRVFVAKLSIINTQFRENSMISESSCLS